VLRRCSLALLAAVPLLLAPPAGAQSPSPSSTPSSSLIRVAAISPFVDATHSFGIRIQVTNTGEAALADVAVTVTFLRPVHSRSELRAALGGARPTGFAGSPLRASVGGPVVPGDQRQVSLHATAAQMSGILARTGVYPVEITVTHSAGESSVFTALPFLGEAPEAQLNVTWILPVARPTVTSADRVYPLDAMRALSLDVLQQQLSVIAQRPGALLTLAPDPALIDAVGDLAAHPKTATGGGADPARAAADATALLQAFRQAASAVGEIATVPYAPVDLAMLAHAGLRDDLARQIAYGRAVVQARTGHSPAGILVPPTLSADRTSLAVIATQQISAIALQTSSLGAPVPGDPRLRPDLFGPSQPIHIRAGDGTIGGLIPDDALAARLDDGEQGALLAQAVIAETASAWLELPSYATQRLLVLDSRTTPSPTALAAGIDGLRAAPWVRMRTATDALSTLLPPAVAPANDAVQLPMLDPGDRSFLRAARRARVSLGALGAITHDTPLPEAAELDRSVLLAESAEWNADPARGTALAEGVIARVRAVLGGIGVAPGRHVTLTSRAGSVPVTVLNRNDFGVRVRVTLVSAKLDFPEGSSRTIDLRPRGDRAASTIDFAIETRATGSFPLEVRIESPDGRLLLSRGSIIVRSTAVSAVTLAATGGSALFLLFAWVRRGARRRKQGRRVTPGANSR
jgi:hypothetical protein